MLKKPLIGAGIGLGVLTLCSTLLVVGAVAGGMAGYLGGRYATSQNLPVPEPQNTPPWQVWPEPEQRWWQWPAPSPMLPDETPQQLWDLVNPALVTEVIADGPADEAGVEVNDIIIALDGRALDDDYRLSEEIPQRNPGEEVLLTVVRRGENTEIFELEITLSTGEDEHGEMVTYLGLWYESISRRGLIVPHAEGALD